MICHYQFQRVADTRVKFSDLSFSIIMKLESNTALFAYQESFNIMAAFRKEIWNRSIYAVAFMLGRDFSYHHIIFFAYKISA